MKDWIMSALVQLFLKYLESHPDQVEKLIEALVEALIQHLGNKSAQQ